MKRPASNYLQKRVGVKSDEFDYEKTINCLAIAKFNRANGLFGIV